MVLVCVCWTNIALECEKTVYMYELKSLLMHYFQIVTFLVMASYPVQTQCLRLSSVADTLIASLTLRTLSQKLPKIADLNATLRYFIKFE